MARGRYTYFEYYVRIEGAPNSRGVLRRQTDMVVRSVSAHAALNEAAIFSQNKDRLTVYAVKKPTPGRVKSNPPLLIAISTSPIGMCSYNMLGAKPSDPEIQKANAS